MVSMEYPKIHTGRGTLSWTACFAYWDFFTLVIGLMAFAGDLDGNGPAILFTNRIFRDPRVS
jgi:hypothetical protein